MMMLMRMTLIMLIHDIADNNDDNSNKYKDNIHLVLFIHVNRSDLSLSQKFLQPHPPFSQIRTHLTIMRCQWG